jgi:hypothetical protein
VYDIPPNTGRVCDPYAVVLIHGPGTAGTAQVKQVMEDVPQFMAVPHVLFVL